MSEDDGGFGIARHSDVCVKDIVAHGKRKGQGLNRTIH
jgi:hypothetical protein